MATKTFKVYASDEVTEPASTFELTEQVLKESETLKHMIEAVGDDNVNPIPLSNIKHATLVKVVEYLKHIEDNQTEKVDKSVLKDKELNEWEKKFCDMPRDDLYQLILAANYLSIPHLLDITCKMVADNLRSKSVEEMREYLGVECDFTESELEQVKKDNSWLESK